MNDCRCGGVRSNEGRVRTIGSATIYTKVETTFWIRTRKILRASARSLALVIGNIFRWKTNFPLDYDGAAFTAGGDTFSIV